MNNENERQNQKYKNKYQNIINDCNYNHIEEKKEHSLNNKKPKYNLKVEKHILRINNKNKNDLKKNKIILNDKEIKFSNKMLEGDCTNISAIEEYMNYYNITDIKNLYKIIYEKSSLNNELNGEIKLLNKKIYDMKNHIKKNISLIEQKKKKINDLNIIINKSKDEINELKKYNDEKNNRIILLENDLIITKKDIIIKNDKINSLNDKYFELVSERNRNRQIINELNKKRYIIEKEKQNEITNLRKVIEDFKIKNNKINNDNTNLIKKSELQKKEINKLESLVNALNEQAKNNKFFKNNVNDNGIIQNNTINRNNNIEININNSFSNKEELNSLDSIKILEKKTNAKRPSTPSFKILELENENVEDCGNCKEIIEINNILLNKIKEYESLLNINKNHDINKIIIGQSDKNIEINNNINYYQNKYIYYFGLDKENKKKIELLEKEIEELNEQLKNNNINNNNLNTTFSAIKLNYQYNPNEYFILSDKIYKHFKWYLMKKQSEYNENDTYDNLIWVSSLDVVDIDNFNEYSKDEDSDNIEMLIFIKKLEEKENIISKLLYKIEKLKKELELSKKINKNNIYNNELVLESNYNFNNNKDSYKWKNKSLNKTIKYFKNSIADESLLNENKCVITFKKDISSLENVVEKKIKNKSKIILKLKEKENEGVALEKYNLILEKLNKTEKEFSKLQKENIELRKNKKLYLNQNNNIVNIIPKNDIGKEKKDNGNNCFINFSSDVNKLTLMGNNFINNINDNGLGLIKNNQNEEH